MHKSKVHKKVHIKKKLFDSVDIFEDEYEPSVALMKIKNRK